MVSSSGESGLYTKRIYAWYMRFVYSLLPLNMDLPTHTGRIATVKVCWLCRTFYLRRRSVCMIRDESMALPTQRDTHVLRKP